MLCWFRLAHFSQPHEFNFHSSFHGQQNQSEAFELLGVDALFLCEEYISDLNISTGLRQKQSRHLSSSSTLTQDDQDDARVCLPDLPVPGCSYRGLRTVT